jgi:hypothetical protein
MRSNTSLPSTSQGSQETNEDEISIVGVIKHVRSSNLQEALKKRLDQEKRGQDNDQSQDQDREARVETEYATSCINMINQQRREASAIEQRLVDTPKSTGTIPKQSRLTNLPTPVPAGPTTEQASASTSGLVRGGTIVGPGNTPPSFVPSTGTQFLSSVPPRPHYMDFSGLLNGTLPNKAIPMMTPPPMDFNNVGLSFDLKNLFTDRFKRTKMHQQDIEKLCSVIKDMHTRHRFEMQRIRTKAAKAHEKATRLSDPMKLIDMRLQDDPDIMDVFNNSIKSILGLLRIGAEATNTFANFLRNVTERRRAENPTVGDIINETFCRYMAKGDPTNEAYIRNVSNLFMYLSKYEVRRREDGDRHDMPPPPPPSASM